MDSSIGRRHDANAVVRSTFQNSPELQRLVEAQATLDLARRNAKWKRECKNLQSASHAVQVAALAAHDAGFGWTEIGDALGIERSTPHSTSTAMQPQPTPQPTPRPTPPPTPELDPARPLTHHVVAATLRHFPEKRQWVPG
jgi:hypothetical protein